MIARRVLLLLSLLALLAPPVLAQGPAGDPRDRLDHPGTPTDRYISAGELRDVLHAQTEAFYGCFRTQARGTRDVGDVAVTFTVGRNGSVMAPQAEVGKAPEALGTCLRDLLSGLRFPEHDGDPVEVSYPLVYQVDQRGARVLPYPVVFTRPRVVRLPLISVPLDLAPGELIMLERILVGSSTQVEEDTESRATEEPSGDD